MRKLYLTAFLLLLAAPAARAQDYDGPGWDASLTGDRHVDSETEAVAHEVTVALDVKPGHYVYLWMEGVDGEHSQRLIIDVGSDLEVTGTRPEFPKPKTKHEKLLDKDVAIYETGTVEIPVAVMFPVEASGPHKLSVSVRAQACTHGRPDGDFCKMPRTVELERNVKLVAAAATPRATATQVASTRTPAPTPSATATEIAVTEAATPAPTDEATPKPTPVVATSRGGSDGSGDDASLWSLLQSEQGLSRMLARGLPFLLLFVFLGGLLVNLTPCVYPLIPITVSVIGAKGANSRGQAFVLALFYVLGMGLVNAALGLVAGLTGQRVGFIFTYPPVVLAIALLLFVLALGMAGVYDLQLPSSVQTRLNQIGGKGPGGVFLMGLVAGVVASPCSTPVLSGIVLTIIAGQVGAVKGFLLMSVFSAGLGLPFLILGTFSGLLTSLPRSGRWMNAVKYGMALGLVVGGYYFLSLVLPDWGFQLALGGGLVAIGVLFGAGKSLAADSTYGPKFAKAVGILGVVAGIYFFLGGLMGSGYGPALFPAQTLITENGSGHSATHSDIPWHHDEPAALAKASATGKPLFIDFFTDECKPCKQLDSQTFSDPAVVGLLSESFVATKLDLTERAWTTDEQREEIDRLVKKYSVQGGVPRLMFVAPDGTILKGLTRTGFEDAEKLSRRLEKALACAETPTTVCRL